MDDVIIIKFGQNVHKKILLTYLQGCVANCTILEVL